MKTPDEIKNALEYCILGICSADHCPYDVKGSTLEECTSELCADALDYIHQVEKQLAELEAAAPKWISVEERLPEPFVSVLAYIPDMTPWSPVREAYRVGNAFYVPALADREHVTHWMPAPAPPIRDLPRTD